jgi:hypothetical protein
MLSVLSHATLKKTKKKIASSPNLDAHVFFPVWERPVESCSLVEEAFADRRAAETRYPIVAAELTLEFIVVSQLLVWANVSILYQNPRVEEAYLSQYLSKHR